MRRSLLIGFSLLVSGICSCAVAQAKPSYTPIQTVQRDERIAHDVAVFNFRQIAAPQTWVVAEVKPDPRGSYSTIPGAYINGNTGKMVSPPDAHFVTVVRGSINILSTLTRQVAPMTQYQWQVRPVFFISRHGEEEGNPSFFSYGPGGTTIARINEKTSEGDQFSPAYLIPHDWAAFVAPALKAQAKTEELTPEAVAAHRAQLGASSSDKNPFVAIEAARTLEQWQLLDADFVRGPLAKSRGFEQSAFAFLVLQQLPSQGALDLPNNGPLTNDLLLKAADKVLSKEPLLEEMGKAIDSAPNARVLQSLATGISAPATDPTRFTILTEERIKVLLRRVDARQKALGTHTAADAYLNLLLHASGVRETVSVSHK